MVGIVVITALLYVLGYVTWCAFNPGNDAVGTV